MKLSRCLTLPARHTTASNGSYFVLRVLLQMLVSVGEMWSMSGALTASGESPSHGSYCLDNDFGSDGLVLTFDNINFSQSLGQTSKFPKDSIAFKWSDELRETVIKQIEWNTSRTGLINPVAIFEPVELEGTNVERASVHNISILEELKLGVGDMIKVYKANMSAIRF